MDIHRSRVREYASTRVREYARMFVGPNIRELKFSDRLGIYEALRAKMRYRAQQEIFFTFIVIREQISIYTVRLCTFYMY